MMTSKNFFSTIAALLLIGFVCSGQTGKVSGRVRDRDTQSPISLANVFINHSTIHALTNAAGEFSLSNIDQPAVYEVVVSFAGYESTKLKISLTDFEVKLGTIFLDRSKDTLNTLSNRTKRDGVWKKNYKRFKDGFLGSDDFAKACEILNPWVIQFSEDKNDHGLIAYADAPLEIENRRLGYRIFTYLGGFKIMSGNHVLPYPARFEELPYASRNELAGWKESREKVYQFSLQHLFKAMIEHRVYQEGFSIHKVSAMGLSSNAWVDTLKLITPTPQPGIYMIAFKGTIEIVYRSRNTQQSTVPIGWIELKKDFILVNREGFEINPTGIITSGKLNDSRIAHLLPMNYKPEHSDNYRSESENAVPVAKLLEKCYVHTDKPYYYPGETIWFKGYINYVDTLWRQSLSRTLHIEFIDPKRKSIVLSKILKIDSGLFHGDFEIPDTLKANTYYLRAYTNLNRNFGDENLYVKPVPILYLMDRPDPSQYSYQQKKHEQIAIQTDKQSYALRDKVTLILQTSNGQKPISANLSVSVTDAEQVIPVEVGADILHYYPIKEIPAIKNSNPVYPIEYGIDFSGQFFNDMGKPKKTVLNMIQIQPRNLFQVETNASGFFTLKDLNFNDSSVFTYKPEIKSSKPSGKVKLLSRAIPKIELPEQKINFKLLLTDSLQREVRIDSLTGDSKFLNEVVVKGKKINTPIQVGTNSVHVIEGSEIQAGNVFLNLMRIPRLRVVISEGSISWIGGSYSNSGGVPLAVFVDGVLRTDPTTPVDALNSVNPNSILFLTVSPGAISVTTKPVWWDDSPKFQILKVRGYSSGRKFQHIDYSDSVANKSTERDIRSTIYWNPNVEITKKRGQTTLSFYSADLPGRYRIVVEGITEEGYPVRAESYITIDNE
ncbi:MAG: carboxypeptidase-like regulatory domain-containing protein [Cyclobacteriaceae bacterium]|jgi:hypothetical protein|nr:carboxypeptidase-like regulatory domain-containing protein [Flammeovirgaceae bacterium]